MLRTRALVVLVVGASLACGGGAQKNRAAAVVHPRGEAASVGTLEVEVHGASRTGKVGGAIVNYAAPEGATLQIVDVSVKNEGDQPTSMVGRFQLVQGDRTFNPTTACQISLKDNWPLLEQVNPGIRRRGKVCFEVPKDAEGLELGVRPGLLSKPAHFAL